MAEIPPAFLSHDKTTRLSFPLIDGIAYIALPSKMSESTSEMLFTVLELSKPALVKGGE